MYRIDNSSAVPALPVPAAVGPNPNHYFTKGNPGSGIPATIVDDDWANAVQEELAYVIEQAGITLSKTSRTQLRQAIQSMITAAQKSVIISSATFEASVANGEVVYWDSANSRFDEALADGSAAQNAVGIADVTNSKVYVFGDAILFSGLTPGSKYYLSAVTPGAITTVAPTNAVIIGIAKSATEVFVDIDLATGITLATADARYLNIGYMLVQDQKPQNTPGGASIAGANTRALNTVMHNTISGASLATNQITLPAGTYRISGWATARDTDRNRAYLYNITDAANAILGSSEDATTNLNSRSTVEGRIVIASTKVFELRHYTQLAVATNGYGVEANNNGVEIYASVQIVKEA